MNDSPMGGVFSGTPKSLPGKISKGYQKKRNKYPGKNERAGEV